MFALQKASLMNKSEQYNQARVSNLSIMIGELNTISTIAIADFQNNDNQAVVNSPIMIAELRDHNKPMGVATYKTSDEMPEALRKAMPDIEELKKLL